MRLALRNVLAIALLLCTATLVAQSTTGTLVGTVQSDGEPLPGVTVTVTSPALQGSRTAVTGDAGGYQFPALPPGAYTVTFDLEGMRRIEKSAVVSLSQTARADAEMSLTSVADEITVTGSTPTAVETTEIAASFDVETINQLPTGRTIDDIVALAPGVTEAGPNDQITISGSMSFESLFLVNGVVVNENVRGQPNPLYIEDAVQETTVLTGGISAEFGRFSGGVVSTVTKSGGNEFSGSLRDSFTNDDWTEKSDFAAQLDPIDDVNNVYEGTLGGRIVRDRLWFFAAMRSEDRETGAQTFDTAIPYDSTREDRRVEGKLTWRATDQHSLVGSYIDSDLEQRNVVTSGRVVDLRSLSFRDDLRELRSLHYSGIFTDRFLLEGQYSEMEHAFALGANSRDLIQGTLLLDATTGQRMWSPTFCGRPCGFKDRNNESWLGKGSYFLSTEATGNHSLVGGFEEFHQKRNENNFQSGSDFRIHGNFLYFGQDVFFGVDPDSSEIEWDPVPALSSTSDFATRSWFLNDRWELNEHWSFNVGVRYDEAFGTDQAGNKTVDDSAFSPRLAARYDLRGDGKHNFSATYGRYVSKVDQGPADNTATAGRYASYYWDYRGPAINPVGTPRDQLLPIEEVIRQVFNWFNSVGGTANRDPNLLTSAHIPGVTLRFDGPLAAPFMDEYTLGYGLTFGDRGGYLRADYIDRNWGDFYVVRRNLQTGTATDPNGDQFDQGVIENGDENLSRKYRAVQLQGRYRPRERLSVGGNYTWARLRGNVEGETASSATSLDNDPTINRPEYQDFEQINPVGYLGPDMRHRATLWLQYDLPTWVGDFNFTLLQRYHSALPYSAIGTIDVRRGTSTGPANGVVNPGYVTTPSSLTYYFSDRGAFRLDDITSTDLGVNWYAPPLRGVSLFIEADILNLFNEQGLQDPDFIDKTVLTRRQTTCLQTGTNERCLPFNPMAGEAPQEGVHWQKGPNFGRPTSAFAYQLPRTYRLSLGLRF
ncbi:MAG TPA: TonB-dependent receptor [Thermoanaerobaculia bacterium]|nr:TonB-dependent receptor [Thermoanaerobaculia bacterium]